MRRMPAPALRLAPAPTLQLSELLGALSHALDITVGQPPGHCLRACWIGQQVGREIGLPEAELRDLYYTVLLKDLGCSSNAARLCELYVTDDLSFKRDFKLVDRSLPHLMRFVLGHTGLKTDLAARFRSVLTVFKEGGDFEQELIQTRCTRGAEIARQLRFSEAVADGIRNLDEHWNGRGKPTGAVGQAIPLFARIALLAQVADVFHASAGSKATLVELARRAGEWFDPALVKAFGRAAEAPGFWETLADPALPDSVIGMEPGRTTVPIDDDYLDDIAAAFGQIIDSKSPYTSGHSGRVAVFADLIAESLGVTPERRRWLRRGALLHDVGKLGVSNAILDKPGKLDDAEWVFMRDHAATTHAILSRIAAFDELARVSAAHHERPDGKGYPLGLRDAQISLETRIISVADFFDALTADRPYRAAMPIPKALAIMEEGVGDAIDARCFAALKAAVLEQAQPLAA